MAVPQRIINDFLEYEEDRLDGDGLTLYRALSRLVYGDPNDYVLVRNAVLDHYLRVWFNAQHPLHQTYSGFPGNVIAHLYQPDLCPRDGTIGIVLQVVANGLSIRLSLSQSQVQLGVPSPRPFVRLATPNWSSAAGLFGLVTFPIHHVGVVQRRKDANAPYQFTSLVEDESGKGLIEFLLDQKQTSQQLVIQEIRCTWDGIDNFGGIQDLQYWNEADPSHGPKDPTFAQQIDSFCIFSVHVRDSRQVRAAVDLLKQAMARAPAQSVSMRRPSGQKAPLKPYCAADGEFFYFTDKDEFGNVMLEEEPKAVDKPTPVNKVDPAEEPKPAEEQGLAEKPKLAGKPKAAEEAVREPDSDQAAEPNLVGESLCGVLSIAVDRHLCVSFHLVDMLRNANHSTAADIEFFCREFLYNAGILKLWFNFQSDITTIDATIAHFYQLTPRPLRRSYDGHRKLQSGRKIRQYLPTWKITGTHLRHHRPRDMYFQPSPQPTGCPFHEEVEPDPNGVFACPCIATGNLDFSTIIDYFNSQYDYHHDRRLWFESRFKLSYAKLLSMLLGSRERLYPLLCYWKGAPNRTATRRDFYNSLEVANIEQDNEKMGYIFNDIVGIALMFRFLTTSDSRRSVLLRLMNVHELHDGAEGWELYQEDPIPGWGFSPFSSVAGIPLIDDNPKLWNRETIAGFTPATRLYGTQACYPIPSTILKSELVPRLRGLLKPSRCSVLAVDGHYEHEKRLLALQTVDFDHLHLEIHDWEYLLVNPEEAQPATMAFNWVLPTPAPVPFDRNPDLFPAHAVLFDPCKLMLPEMCTYEAIDVINGVNTNMYNAFPGPILHSTKTHEEDLLEIIQHNSAQGLPPGIEACVENALDGPNTGNRMRTIIEKVRTRWLEAERQDTRWNDLGGFIPPPLLQLAPKSVNSTTRREQNIRRNHRRAWVMYMNNRLHEIEETIEAINVEEAIDLLDPNGTAYQQAIATAADWNHPPLWKLADRTHLLPGYRLVRESMILDLEEQLGLAENDDLYSLPARVIRIFARLRTFRWTRPRMERPSFYRDSGVKLRNNLSGVPSGAPGPPGTIRPGYHYEDHTGRDYPALDLPEVPLLKKIFWIVLGLLTVIPVVMLYYTHSGNVKRVNVTPNANYDDYIVFVLRGAIQ